MKSEEIDELFREGTQEHFPYDENLWNQVAADLPPSKQKRRFGGYWILGSAILIALLSGIYFVSPEEEQPIAEKSETAISEETISMAESTSSSSTIESIETRPSENSNSNSPSPKSQQKTAEESKPSNSQQIYNTTNNGSAQETLKTELEKDDQYATKQESDVEIASPSASAYSLSDNKRDQFNSSFIDTDSNDDLASLSIGKLADKKQFQDNLREENMKLMTPFGFHNSSLNKEPIESRSLIEHPTYYSPPILLELQYNTSLNLENRNQKEANVSVNQFALLGIKSKGTFSYGAGIRYLKLRESVSYNVEDERLVQTAVSDTNYVLVNGNYSQNGAPIWLIKEEITTTIDEKLQSENTIVNGENILESIQLPIFVGYSYPMGNYELGLRTSMVLSYLYAAEGYYLDEDLQSLVKIENPSSTESFSINMEADLRLGYRLNEYSLIGTSFRYQYDISGIATYDEAKYDGMLFGLWIQHQFK